MTCSARPEALTQGSWPTVPAVGQIIHLSAHVKGPGLTEKTPLDQSSSVAEGADPVLPAPRLSQPWRRRDSLTRLQREQRCVTSFCESELTTN